MEKLKHFAVCVIDLPLFYLPQKQKEPFKALFIQNKTNPLLYNLMQHLIKAQVLL